MFDENHIPFEFDDVYHGLAVSKGILYALDSKLKFEFQTSDNILNVLKSNVKEIELDYLQISSITFYKKIFSKKIIIQLNSMKILSKFPNSPSELILKIKRQNVTKAATIVNYITLKINEKRLEYLENN